MLRSKGYVTGAFGKWGLGYMETEGDPNRRDLMSFMAITARAWLIIIILTISGIIMKRFCLKKNDSSKTGTYSADLIHKAAIDFLKRIKTGPFFCSIQLPCRMQNSLQKKNI